jgi:hypothetical protein
MYIVVNAGIIAAYLPKQISDEEAKAAIAGVVGEIGAQGMKDMGKVMAALKQRYAGKMDFGKAGPIVKGLLSSEGLIPPPLAGEVGAKRRVGASNVSARCPLPNPPPQAGEGTQRRLWIAGTIRRSTAQGRFEPIVRRSESVASAHALSAPVSR